MSNVFNINDSGELGLSYSILLTINLSEGGIKKSLWRNRKGLTSAWQHWTDNNGHVWILYISLPLDSKIEVDKYFGIPIWDAWRNDKLRTLVRLAERAEDQAYFMGLGLYKAEQAANLMRASAWLRCLNDYAWVNDCKMGGKIAGLSYVASLIASENLYGFKVENGRVLERRIKRYKAAGLASLVSEKWSNLNALKGNGDIVDTITGQVFTKAEVHRIAVTRFIDLYASPLKLSIEQVANVYNMEAQERGFPTYTTMRVMQILKDPSNVIKWSVSRDGAVLTRANREAIIRRERPGVNDLWSIDGTTVQLYATDDKGKLLKVGYWVLVTDAATDCIIGWSFGVTETAQLVLQALRMAVGRSMCLPRFVQYDNARANLSAEVKEVLEGMNAIGLRAQPYNGKSKYIERTIGMLESLMRSMPNFVGGNITAKSNRSRANPEFLRKLIENDDIPTVTECIDQMRLIVEVFNHKRTAKLGMTRNRAYMLGLDNSKKTNELSIVALFWVKRPQTYQYTNGGIAFELQGKRFEYVVEDERGVESTLFREKWLGERFWIRYNPDDMTKVHLYDNNDVHIAIANERYLFQAIPTVGEMQLLKKNWNNRKQEIDKSRQAAQAIRTESDLNGFKAVDFELVNKEAYNEAMAYLEDKSNGVGSMSPGMEQENKNNYSLYDIDESQLMQVLE